MNHEKSTKFIGPVMLAMIAVSAIISLRNLPVAAIHGSAAIGFYIAAGGLFLIPIALCCAELASSMPNQGGIYHWVKTAFGNKIGLLAIWLEWAGSVIWLPAVLGFLATTTAYLIEPVIQVNLMDNKLFLVFVMLTYLWSATLLNFRGLHDSSLVSSLGVVIGSLIPAVLLIILGSSAIPQAIENKQLIFSFNHIVPKLDFSVLATFTGLLLSFAGMEIPAYYVNNVKNPQKNFPKAMLIAAAIILTISILGTLAIAASIPSKQINLLGGTMQSFYIFFQQFNLAWLTPILALFILIGGFALLNTWIIGPSRGLLTCAEAGDIPKIFRHTNNKDVPTFLLLLQSIIGTIIISFYQFSASINAAFWLFNTLAAQTYLIMYSLVFASCLYLRYSQPNLNRSYKIPGGKFGIWVTAGAGFIACVIAIVVGFAKPTTIEVNISQMHFFLLLITGITICILPPFLYKKFNNN